MRGCCGFGIGVRFGWWAGGEGVKAEEVCRSCAQTAWMAFFTNQQTLSTCETHSIMAEEEDPIQTHIDAVSDPKLDGVNPVLRPRDETVAADVLPLHNLGDRSAAMAQPAKRQPAPEEDTVRDRL